MNRYASWGNWPRAAMRRHMADGGAERPVTITAVAAALQNPLSGGASLLPYGNGRSQGDSCLNEGGGLIDMRGLNHLISFDTNRGRIRCEAGITLAELLSVIIPRGWFLAVTPGTKYVTVGGAIANDVHGKNHPTAGTFGHHVRQLQIVRSTGEQLVCSDTSNPELFRATIGGLGLTGVIVSAELQLRPMRSQLIAQQVMRMSSLDDFWRATEAPGFKSEYCVAWLDCLARGPKLGRGLLTLGNHITGSSGEAGNAFNSKQLTPRVNMLFDAPAWLTGRTSVKIFNWVWRHKIRAVGKPHPVHFNQFFYPLDGVGEWNRLYGQRGFFQYQCVVPRDTAHEVIRELLARIADSGLASFLSTLKYFGDMPPAGLLSFARPGISLAVDFGNQGQRTLDLFDQLDDVVRLASGALYPAKDARMSPAMFAASFPKLPEFRRFVDPALSSSFWRRVTKSE